MADFEAIIDYGFERKLPKAIAVKKAWLINNLSELVKEHNLPKVENFVKNFFLEREANCLQTTNQKQQTTSSKKVKSGFIYVLEGSDRVKVSFSINPEARIKTLSRWQGELKIVFTCKS